MVSAVVCAGAAGAPRTPTLVAESSPAEKNVVSVSISGDLLVHTPLWEAARRGSGYDFVPQLRAVSRLLGADVDICHMETPVRARTPRSYPVFSTPKQLAEAIKSTGWEGCSVASNHSLDGGTDGVRETLENLHAKNLVTAGTRATEPVPGTGDSAIGWYTTAGGVRVANLAYTFSTNGIRAKHPWLVNMLSGSEIVADAKEAHNSGAEIVVVSLHWGNEYQATPTSSQRKLARRLVASPYVDAVVGHHAHVVQDAEVISGKPVVYGVGNLWSGQGPWSGRASSQWGAVVTLRFTRDSAGHWGWTDGDAVPVITLPTNWSVVPVSELPSRYRSVGRAARADLEKRMGAVLQILDR